MTEPSERSCPMCASMDLVPVVRGLPDPTDAGEATLQRHSEWHCRGCGADSTDRPRPRRFAVWDSDATAAEIANWIGNQANARTSHD